MELKYQTLVYEILDLIDKNGGSMVYADILNAFLPNVPPTKTDNTLCHMIDENLISGKIPSAELITLTSKGHQELDKSRDKLAKESEERRAFEEQMRKKVAEDKANKHSDRRHQFFHDILLLLIGALIAFIFDHISTIWDFFASFFN